MAEPGDRISRRYRELAREEPPRALDDAILAASRREVGAGPQRARSGTSRWMGPVSIAAVLVLGIGVSLRMQLDKPGIETSMPASPPASEYSMPDSSEPAPPPAAAPPAATQPAPVAPATRSAPARQSSPQPQPAPAPQPKVTAPQAEMARQEPMADLAKPLGKRNEAPAERLDAPAPAAAAAAPAGVAEPPAPRAPPPTSVTATIGAGAAPSPQQAPMRAKREGFAADSAARESRAIAAAADPDPARELERIARLRDAGRHAEADRALEELRRRHPDYRIPEAIWERVKPR